MTLVLPVTHSTPVTLAASKKTLCTVVASALPVALCAQWLQQAWLPCT